MSNPPYVASSASVAPTAASAGAGSSTASFVTFSKLTIRSRGVWIRAVRGISSSSYGSYGSSRYLKALFTVYPRPCGGAGFGFGFARGFARGFGFGFGFSASESGPGS